MIPFLVLLAVSLTFRLIGMSFFPALDNWIMPLRIGLSAMFFLTASAHWGKRRPDLIRMVPPVFPKPDVLVTATGVLEILGAIGLLIPSTARAAATCLAILLIAMFPANVHAARRNLAISGQAVTALPLRTVLQIVFIAALIAAGYWHDI